MNMVGLLLGFVLVAWSCVVNGAPPSAECPLVKCEAPLCSREDYYYPPNKCCPICKETQDGCRYNEQWYNHGETWNDGCRKCRCNKGTVKCSNCDQDCAAVSCLKLECEQQVYPAGSCCPICKPGPDNRCRDRFGIPKNDGKEIPTPQDPCKSCHCDNGEIMCYYILCALCVGETKPNQCCPSCSFDPL